MGFMPFESIFQGMGITKPGSSDRLGDPYSAGGSDQGLDTTGQAWAQWIREQLVTNPYARFQGASFRPTPPTLALGPNDLTAGQTGAFKQAVRQALSGLSGNFSNLGFNTPRAVGALAGSAARDVAPLYADLMTRNRAEEFQQALSNTKLGLQTQQFNQEFLAGLEQQRMNQALNLLPAYNRTTQRGPGLSYLASKTATENWYDMWNNIGSAWGSMGANKAVAKAGAKTQTTP